MLEPHVPEWKFLALHVHLVVQPGFVHHPHMGQVWEIAGFEPAEGGEQVNFFSVSNSFLELDCLGGRREHVVTAQGDHLERFEAL